MYNYTKHGKKATITSYNGNDEIVKIPTEIDGYTVTTIESLAFCGNETVREIYVPENIKLNENAVTYCPNLETIYLGGKNKTSILLEDCDNAKIVISNNREYKRISKFIPDEKILNLGIFEIIETEESVKIISIKSKLHHGDKLIIPNYINGKKVTKLSSGLFEYQTFKEVVLNDFIETIPANCFNNAYVEKITHMENIKTIEAYAFAYCSAEIEVFLENVEVIKESAFKGSTIKEIILSNKLKELGQEAFYGCFIESLDLSMCKITLSPGLFQYSKLKTISLPKNTTKIPRNCFYACKNLKTVNNVNKLSYIDDYAFGNCERLILSLNFKKLEYIGISALASVTINKTVKIGKTDFGETALKNTKGIETVIFTDEYKKEYIPKYFLSCSSVKKVQLNNNITTIKYEAFGYTELNSINLENVKIIDDSAFERTKIRKINLNNLESLGRYAFSRCSNLTTVDFATNNVLKIISNYAFNCTKIKELILPKTITHIGCNAFSSVGKLKEICLPENVEYVGDSAFAYNTINTFKITGNTIFSHAFYGTIIKNIEITNLNKVEGLFTFKYDFKTIIANVTNNEIPESYFKNVQADNVIINGSIERIGEEAFAYSKIKKLTIDTSAVKEIASEAFCCAVIANFDIIETAEKYAKHCFNGFSSKKKVLRFINAKEFEKAAFQYNYTLINKINIELPNDVEIGTCNFENNAITVKTNKNIYKKLKIRKHFKNHENLLVCDD